MRDPAANDLGERAVSLSRVSKGCGDLIVTAGRHAGGPQGPAYRRMPANGRLPLAQRLRFVQTRPCRLLQGVAPLAELLEPRIVRVGAHWSLLLQRVELLAELFQSRSFGVGPLSLTLQRLDVRCQLLRGLGWPALLLERRDLRLELQVLLVLGILFHLRRHG